MTNMNAARSTFAILLLLVGAITTTGLLSPSRMVGRPPVAAMDSTKEVSTLVPIGSAGSQVGAKPTNDQERDPSDPVAQGGANEAAQGGANEAAQGGANEAGAGAQPSMQDLIVLAEDMLQHVRTHVVDYQGTLLKRERISGVLADESRMQFKIRNPQIAIRPKQPATSSKTDDSSQTPRGLSAYLKFEEPRAVRGREVIWVDGENSGKLIVHEAGLMNLLRVELTPTGRLAMLGNKYPITEIGMLRLIEKLIEKIDRGVDLSRCTIETRDDQRVGDRPCRLIQVTQPRNVPGADFYVAQVFLDTERNIPLRYAAFLWPEQAGEPPPLEEEYTYFDVELNVGLTDLDFDPNNPAYNYP